MGYGNPTPIADLKRQHAGRRAAADRSAALEARFTLAAKLIAHYPAYVPTFLLAAALSDPAECALCLSPYADCWVHG